MVKKPKSVELSYQTRWALGDRSNDGHGRTADINFKSNMSPQKIWEAYCKTCEELQYGFHHDWSRVSKFNALLADNEDDTLPLEFVNILISKGFDVQTLESFHDQKDRKGFDAEYAPTGELVKINCLGEDRHGVIREDLYVFSEEELVDLLMWYVKYSEPTFRYEIIKSRDVNPMHIGYGIFRN